LGPPRSTWKGTLRMSSTRNTRVSSGEKVETNFRLMYSELSEVSELFRTFDSMYSENYLRYVRKSVLQNCPEAHS
jgi:hypothetical protein